MKDFKISKKNSKKCYRRVKELPEKEKEKKYKDYTTFKPEIIKYINEEESELINKFRPIIRALRNKNMTVKEIHDLFRDPETGKHTLTRKTIYRYLEKLEEGGLVVISGHRETEGQRQIEKLYSRSASIFYRDKDEQYMRSKECDSKKQAQLMATVIKEALEKPTINVEELGEILFQYTKQELKTNKKLISSLPSNKVLAELYSTTELDELNYVVSYALMFIILYQNPELYNKLKKIIEK